MIYAGIDEAGYGPILGPLCVASSVLRIPDEAGGATTPDIWEILGPVVCRTRGEASTSRLAVADSKQLKLANSVKRQHPLPHLELGVLAFLGSVDPKPEPCATVSDLLDRLGAQPGDLPWYAPHHDVALPMGTTPDHLRLMTTRLRSVCEKAGVCPVEIRCLAACEQRFNADLVRMRTKAAVSFRRVAALLARVWKSDAATEDDPACCPRIVVDRQGGRARYAQSLASALPDATVEIVLESPTRSVYDLVGKGRRMRVSFEVEAELRHLPVALASMTAKLVRELLVARLNAYWQERCAELKPTAGYALDGGRYLRDLAGVATPEQLAMLRRNA